MSNPPHFPWPRMMHLGLGQLGWAPDQFWRSTLRELVAAFSPAQTGFSRLDLEGLMRAHPDD